MMQPGTTQASSNPVDIAVKEFILNTIRQFVPADDSVGKMLFGMLRRMLNYATHQDIVNVLTELDKFVKGARANGIILDGDFDSVDVDYGEIGDEVPGSWTVNRQDTPGEVNTSEGASDEVLLSVPEPESGLETSEDSSAGYETPMAGHDLSIYTDTEALREDGTGRHDTGDSSNQHERMETGLG
jgi:hypothetical protein